MSTQVVWPLNENGEIVFSAGTGSSNVTGYLSQDVLPSNPLGSVPVVVGGEAALKRKPRKLFKKLYDAASGITSVKVVPFGDSLAFEKIQHLTASLSRRLGGYSAFGVNIAGNVASAGEFLAGRTCSVGTSSGVTALTSRYDYWPTGIASLFTDGATSTFVTGGVNPTFTDVKVYFVKQPSAGDLSLSVGGSVVQTVSANSSSVSLGILSYTKTVGQAAVSVTASSGDVVVLFVQVSNSTVSGVNFYTTFGRFGLSIADAMSSEQGVSLFRSVLEDISPDFVTFEMDDNVGSNQTLQEAFEKFSQSIKLSAKYADKLFIASTPRLSDDSGKKSSRDYLKSFCSSEDNSFLFFDSYSAVGSYQDMIDIFGSDDGVHPNKAAQAYTAELIWDYLALNTFNIGYVSRAVNDPSTASNLAKGTRFQSAASDRGTDVSVETDSFGYDWNVKYPRSISFNTRGQYGSSSALVWQFSGNAAVKPNVMPLTLDFISEGNVRKLTTSTSTGYEFLQFKKTDNTGGGFMHMQTGLIRNGFTRAELLAIPANSVIGAAAYCTDCTGGAQWVYAKGVNPTDWVTIDGKSPI